MFITTTTTVVGKYKSEWILRLDKFRRWVFEIVFTISHSFKRHFTAIAIATHKFVFLPNYVLALKNSFTKITLGVLLFYTYYDMVLTNFYKSFAYYYNLIR